MFCALQMTLDICLASPLIYLLASSEYAARLVCSVQFVHPAKNADSHTMILTLILTAPLLPHHHLDRRQLLNFSSMIKEDHSSGGQIIMP